jgi:hypothetical protein
MDDLKTASIESKSRESIIKLDPKLPTNDLETLESRNSNNKAENINLTTPKNVFNDDLNIDLNTGFQSRFGIFSTHNQMVLIN